VRKEAQQAGFVSDSKIYVVGQKRSFLNRWYVSEFAARH